MLADTAVTPASSSPGLAHAPADETTKAATAMSSSATRLGLVMLNGTYRSLGNDRRGRPCPASRHQRVGARHPSARRALTAAFCVAASALQRGLLDDRRRLL